MRAWRSRVIVWDWKHHDYDGLELVTCRSIAQLARALKAGELRVRYLPTYVDTPGEFERFLRAAWYVQQADPRDCLLVVEELSQVTRPTWAPAWWRRVVNLGRVWGLTVVGVAQRPAMVDKDFIGGSTYVRCGRLRYEEDARELARFLGVPFQQIQRLPDRAAYVSDGVGETRLEGAALRT